MEVPKKLEMELPYDATIPFLGIVQNYIYIYAHIYNVYIYNLYINI